MSHKTMPYFWAMMRDDLTCQAAMIQQIAPGSA
jgi:hypothetical protein